MAKFHRNLVSKDKNSSSKYWQKLGLLKIDTLRYQVTSNPFPDKGHPFVMYAKLSEN